MERAAGGDACHAQEFQSGAGGGGGEGEGEGRTTHAQSQYTCIYRQSSIAVCGFVFITPRISGAKLATPLSLFSLDL